MLKKTISAIALATLALGAQAADVVLKVAASAVPHAEILNFVKPQLKAQGVDLQVREFSDYIQPNAAVEEKQLDANFFQHQPYLDSYNRDRKSSIVGVADGTVHVEPFGAYSRKIRAASELKDGATVAIPNDPANTGRALLLLQKQGLIELKDPKNITATPVDIVKNPKNLKFRELEAALLPRALVEDHLPTVFEDRRQVSGRNEHLAEILGSSVEQVKPMKRDQGRDVRHDFCSARRAVQRQQCALAFASISGMETVRRVDAEPR